MKTQKTQKTIFTSMFKVYVEVKDYGYVTCIVMGNGLGDAKSRVVEYYKEHGLYASPKKAFRIDYDVIEVV